MTGSNPSTLARLRPAERHDTQRLKQIANAAYGIYADVLATPPQPVRDDYMALVNDDAVFVAENQEGVAGFTVLLPIHNALLLHALAVAPEAQRQGVGAQLLHFALTHAIGQGLPALEVSLEKAMLPLLGWFGRFGFETIRSPGPGGYQRYYLRRRLP